MASHTLWGRLALDYDNHPYIISLSYSVGQY